MNWTTFEQALQTPTPAIWLAIAAASIFALMLIVMLLRAERSVANTALAIITIVALGVTAFVTLRAPTADNAASGVRGPMPGGASLACVDDLAGEIVAAGCEKVVFGSADAIAAAVSYTAARLTRLTALGDVTAANAVLTPDLQALRQSIERDRYGLAAYVLMARDQCSATACSAFQSLTDRSKIVANMNDKLYDGLVERHAAAWNAPATIVTSPPGVAAMPSAVTMPTGRPTNAEFPTSASIPPVSIMNPEPAAPAPRTNASPPAAARTAPPASQAAVPQARKQPTSKQAQRPATPVQIAPPPSSTAPSAADE